MWKPAINIKANNLLAALAIFLFAIGVGGCVFPPSPAEAPLAAPTALGATAAYLEAGEDRNAVEGEVPRRIAVMPAGGLGDLPVRETVRIAIHNHLSALPFELVKPFRVDRELLVLKESPGAEIAESSPGEVAEALGVEGLILVEVKAVEKLYGMAYAHYHLAVEVSFYSALEDRTIWKDALEMTERSGGIFQTPLGFLSTAITSTTVLSDQVRIMLTEKLARQFSRRIPLPADDRGWKPPPRIETAFSNAAEGPFRAGDEIRILASAEPGLSATVDLGSRISGVPLAEIEAGEYLGRHLVVEGDDAGGIIPRLHFFKPSNRTRLDWHVPGRVDIDTIPPGEVVEVAARSTSAGIRLTWRSADDPRHIESFRIARAQRERGRFEELGVTALTEFVDSGAETGLVYHYRVLALDAAGNEGPAASVRIRAAPPGPTPLSGTLEEDLTLSAAGSPHVLTGTFLVPAGTLLRLEPGTLLEMKPESRLEILGELAMEGSQEAPIRVRGERWSMIFEGGGASVLHHVRVAGGAGSLRLNNARVNLRDCLITGLEHGLDLRGRSRATVRKSTLQGNGTALGVTNSRLDLADVELIENGIGLQVAGASDVRLENPFFRDNGIHVRSDIFLSIPQRAFADRDFMALRSKVEGRAEIRWPSDDRESLLERWIESQLRTLGRHLEKDDIAAAAGAAARLAEFVPVPKTTMVAEVMEALLRQEPPPYALAGSAAAFLYRYFQLPPEERRDLSFWLQEFEVPAPEGGVLTERYLSDSARRRAGRMYLRSRLPALDRRELRAAGSKLNLVRHFESALPLHRSRRGLFVRGWVLHMVEKKGIDRQLAQAGLIQRPPSRLVVGILGQEGGDPGFPRALAGLLRGQNISFLSLGQGAPGEELFERAREQETHLILEARSAFKASSTGLSPRLKRLEGILEIFLHETESGRLINHYRRQNNLVIFQEEEGRRKMIEETLDKTGPKLLDELLIYDDRLEVH